MKLMSMMKQQFKSMVTQCKSKVSIMSLQKVQTETIVKIRHQAALPGHGIVPTVNGRIGWHKTAQKVVVYVQDYIRGSLNFN